MMRRIFLALLLVVLAVPRLRAQDRNLFTGGLVAGLNFAQVDGDDYYGYHRIGVTAGGMVYLHFTEHWGLSMELLYAQKGSKGGVVSEYPGVGVAVDKYFIKLSYAEVPVTFHFAYKKLDLEAGLSYGRLINANEYAISSQTVIFDQDKNRFNSTDLEYVFGVAYQVHKHWSINFRFQYSVVPMRPIERIPTGFVWGTNGQFNNLLSLRVAYLL
jgi:opacity protein-like surface antigen